MSEHRSDRPTWLSSVLSDRSAQWPHSANARETKTSCVSSPPPFGLKERRITVRVIVRPEYVLSITEVLAQPIQSGLDDRDFGSIQLHRRASDLERVDVLEIQLALLDVQPVQFGEGFQVG